MQLEVLLVAAPQDYSHKSTLAVHWRNSLEEKGEISNRVVFSKDFTAPASTNPIRVLTPENVLDFEAAAI